MTYQPLDVTTLCPVCDAPITGRVRMAEGGAWDELIYEVDYDAHGCDATDDQVSDGLIVAYHEAAA